MITDAISGNSGAWDSLRLGGRECQESPIRTRGRAGSWENLGRALYVPGISPWPPAVGFIIHDTEQGCPLGKGLTYPCEPRVPSLKKGDENIVGFIQGHVYKVLGRMLG